MRKKITRKRKSSKKKESGRSVETKMGALIKCAFCRGRGTDRFGVPSRLSQCQVCKGRGKVYVPEPYEKCMSCLGTGVYRHHRLTCSVCGGKGRVRQINRTRSAEECEKEDEEAIDVNTGLPCINAYELGEVEK